VWCPSLEPAVTVAAAVVGFFSAVMIAINVYAAVALLLLSQILDCTDGDLARMTGRVTKRGAYLDRIFDRFVDAAVIIAIVHISPAELWFQGFLALVFSLTVSLSRAMAEAEGVECKVGIGSRDTRTAVVIVGLILGSFQDIFYSLTLWLLAILGFLTTFHRIIHTLRQLP